MYISRDVPRSGARLTVVPGTATPAISQLDDFKDKRPPTTSTVGHESRRQHNITSRGSDHRLVVRSRLACNIDGSSLILPRGRGDGVEKHNATE